MKDLEDIHADLVHLGVAEWYHKAITQLLLRMFNDGFLPQKEPMIKNGKQKQTGDRKWTEFIKYHLFKQMLTDFGLREAYLLEAELVFEYGVREYKNKEYLTLHFKF